MKTLCLTWEPATDRLSIKVLNWRSEAPVTHSIILSEVAKMFDPYGLVGPVIVMGKLFLQAL